MSRYEYQYEAASEENADELKNVEDELEPDSSFIFPPHFKFLEDQINHKMDDLKQIEESKIEKVDTKDDDAALMEDSVIIITTEIPLPPRFKYMKKQINQEKEEVEEEIKKDANVAIESTTAGQMLSIAEEQTERNDQTTTTEIPLPPRFKYMEKQIKQDKEELEEVDEAQNDATAAIESTTAGHFPVQIVVEDDDVVAKEGLELFDIREDIFGQGHRSVQKKVYNKEEKQLALKNMDEEEEENAPQPPVVLNISEELKKSNGWFSWLPFW